MWVPVYDSWYQVQIHLLISITVKNLMEKIKKNARDPFFYICARLGVISVSLLGMWLVFRSYTPIPAAAEMAGMVLGWAMVFLIIASIWGCLYIIHLVIRT